MFCLKSLLGTLSIWAFRHFWANLSLLYFTVVKWSNAQALGSHCLGLHHFLSDFEKLNFSVSWGFFMGTVEMMRDLPDTAIVQIK